MLINILTRTHNRALYFKICRKSVESQTYKNINWLVGSDMNCQYYKDYIHLIRDYREPVILDPRLYPAPYNLYLNQMQQHVKDGWIMYLDDDDCFFSENSVQTIVDNIENDNQLLVWKVKIFDNFIVPSYSFGNYVTAGDFSGIGMAFHSKHLPVDWGNISYGDFRVAMQLLMKGLEVKWINQILTETIEGAHNGK